MFDKIPDPDPPRQATERDPSQSDASSGTDGNLELDAHTLGQAGVSQREPKVKGRHGG